MLGKFWKLRTWFQETDLMSRVVSNGKSYEDNPNLIVIKDESIYKQKHNYYIDYI